MPTPNAPQKVIESIAKKCFDVDTLESRNRDCLDFHSVSVWSIKEALTQAYNAGKKENTHA